MCSTLDDDRPRPATDVSVVIDKAAEIVNGLREKFGPRTVAEHDRMHLIDVAT